MSRPLTIPWLQALVRPTVYNPLGHLKRRRSFGISRLWVSTIVKEQLDSVRASLKTGKVQGRLALEERSADVQICVGFRPCAEQHGRNVVVTLAGRVNQCRHTSVHGTVGIRP